MDQVRLETLHQLVDGSRPRNDQPDLGVSRERDAGKTYQLNRAALNGAFLGPGGVGGCRIAGSNNCALPSQVGKPADGQRGDDGDSIYLRWVRVGTEQDAH
jgi:hypothetical protein